MITATMCNDWTDAMRASVLQHIHTKTLAGVFRKFESETFSFDRRILWDRGSDEIRFEEYDEGNSLSDPTTTTPAMPKSWRIKFRTGTNSPESSCQAEQRCLMYMNAWIHQTPWRDQQFEEMRPFFFGLWDELLSIYGTPKVVMADEAKIQSTKEEM